LSKGKSSDLLFNPDHQFTKKVDKKSLQQLKKSLQKNGTSTKHPQNVTDKKQQVESYFR